MLLANSIPTKIESICLRASVHSCVLSVAWRRVMRTRLGRIGRISRKQHFDNSPTFKFCIAMNARAVTGGKFILQLGNYMEKSQNKTPLLHHNRTTNIYALEGGWKSCQIIAPSTARKFKIFQEDLNAPPIASENSQKKHYNIIKRLIFVYYSKIVFKI